MLKKLWVLHYRRLGRSQYPLDRCHRRGSQRAMRWHRTIAILWPSRPQAVVPGMAADAASRAATQTPCRGRFDGMNALVAASADAPKAAAA
jgi:hypothetical protein